MIAGVLEAFGVDPRTFGVLHKAFWALSRREASGLIQGRDATKAPGVGAGLWMYVLLGGLTSFAALSGGPRDLYGTGILGMTLVMTALAVVADFAAVVVAPGDDEILFHLPLSSRTYLAARLTVAARHAGLIAIAFAALPSIAGGLRWGNPLYAAGLLAAAVWTGWFALILGFLVYRIALATLGGERTRTLLAYVPGVLSLLFAFGPQFLSAARPSGLDREAVEAAFDRSAPWIPSAWFSAIVEACLGDFSPRMLSRAGIGAAAVPLGAWILVGALGRGFLADLQRLVSGKDEGRARATRRSTRPAPSTLSQALFGGRSAEARAAWLLYRGAMRSRASRARIFPMLVMPVVLATLGALRAGPWGAGGTTMVFLALYLVAASGLGLAAFLPYHENRDAAWLLEAAPLERYGTFYVGVLRAMLACHVLPLFVALSAFLIAIEPRPETVGAILLPASAGLLSTALAAWAWGDRVPFSRAFSPGEQGAGFAIGLMNVVLVGVVGGLHAVVSAFFPWAFLVTAPAIGGIALLWLRATAARLDRFPPLALRPTRV